MQRNADAAAPYGLPQRERQHEARSVAAPLGVIQVRPVDIAKQITTGRRSADAEAHWVPRANENGAGLEQQHAATSRGLGERDWAATDPLQVRTSKGVRQYFTGTLYYWERTRSHESCESPAERWEVLWLDYGGQLSNARWGARARSVRTARVGHRPTTECVFSGP